MEIGEGLVKFGNRGENDVDKTLSKRDSCRFLTPISLRPTRPL